MIETRTFVEHDNYIIEVWDGEDLLKRFEYYTNLPMMEFRACLMDDYYSTCIRNGWPISYVPEMELYDMQHGIPLGYRHLAKELIWKEYARRRNAAKYF